MSDAPTLESVASLPSSEEKLAAWALLSATTTDPKVALEAKIHEVMDARHLGRQEHAIVAGTELLGLVARCPELPDRTAWGLKFAVGAALDIPEIPLETVDRLIAVLGEVLAAQGKQPWAAWQLQARRAFVAGEDVSGWVERLAPRVSRTHHVREDLDCPGCSLAQFAQFLGPDTRPEVLWEVLEPILSGRLTYRNEDPAFLPVLRLLYGERESCANGLQATHAWYARALLRAGRLEEAARHVRSALAHRSSSEVGMWALIAWLELAEATRDAPQEAAALDELLAHLDTHEDANEALEMASIAARVLARRGDPRADGLRATATSLAHRLDARLARPRHVAALR